MNVNGSLYHLFLGQDDWKRCSVAHSGSTQSLDLLWRDPLTTAEREWAPEWREDIASIAIARQPETIAPTPGEPSVRLADRRGVAADRHGNIYSVASDRTAIEVQAAGERHRSPFWPDLRGQPRPRDEGFADAEPAESLRQFGALAALGGDYLVAISRETELLRFDLIGGGGPETVKFAELPGLRITAIAPATDGGAYMLDDAAKKLYRLTSDLRLCGEYGESAQSIFTTGETEAHRPDPAPFTPWSADLSALDQPISVAVLDDRYALVLDHRSGATCGLYLVDVSFGDVRLLLDCSFDALGMVLAPETGGEESNSPSRTLLFWSAIGNQAHAVALSPAAHGWLAAEDPRLRPMRRFAGRGLVAAAEHVFYDSGDPMRWVALAVKHRCSFAPQTRFTTPVLDSDIYQCTWDRIRFDGAIPAGCTIRIEARCFDEEPLFSIDAEAGWREQPQAYANGDGAELPSLAFPRLIDADPSRKPCWDLLLQDMRARFIQLRITLIGDGRHTPSLSALRIWFPRFSYSQRFLPRVYSEDESTADFTERFLANMEGVNTSLEERIAAARLLIDPRTVPEDALDWLADWFDVALDPSWDERRRRLFIRHAVDFFGWRGTVPGLLMALALAFDPTIDECDFLFPGAPQDGLSGIRIVEHFRTRLGRRYFPEADARPGIHAVIDMGSLWHPAEAKAGLAERWNRARGQTGADASLENSPFSLASADHNDGDWSGFARRQFGFVPSLGARERENWHDFLSGLGLEHAELPLPADGTAANVPEWQDFLAIHDPDRGLWHDLLIRRYASVERLNHAWRSDWLAIDDIPMPDTLPESEAAVRDWLDFEGLLAPIYRGAHRFSVLIPRQGNAFDPAAEQRAIALAQRIVALEKPAHTVFDVRLFWAMNRIGEARLGRDTQIGEGSRSPQLVPSGILGRTAIGASFAGGPQFADGGRELLSC